MPVAAEHWPLLAERTCGGICRMAKRREKTVDGGDAKVVDDQAPSPEEGLQLAQEILGDCPEGYHPWRVQVQKSDRGRRSSVRVWFRKNRGGPNAD